MSDPQKVTYKREWVVGVVHKIAKIALYALIIVAVFGIGWQVRATTIEPPHLPPNTVIMPVSTMDQMRQQAQRGADDMKASVDKEKKSTMKVFMVTTGYCAQWLRIKNLPTAFDTGHFAQQPGPAPDNVYSPLWNTAQQLYDDATKDLEKHGADDFPDFPKWVSTMCPYT